MEIKLIGAFAALIVMAGEFFSSIGETINVALNVAALAVIAAGFLVYGRLRAVAKASEDAAEAWRGERDAAVAKADRLELALKAIESELHDARVMIATLEARPTLDTLALEIAKLRDVIGSTRDAVSDSDATSTTVT